MPVQTVHDVMDGTRPESQTRVFCSDNCVAGGWVLGGVITEALRSSGQAETDVSEADGVWAWAINSAERGRVLSHHMALRVKIVTAQSLGSFNGASAKRLCGHSGAS